MNNYNIEKTPSIMVTNVYGLDQYIISSDIPLNIGDSLYKKKESEVKNTDCKKTSHQLRKMYFKLVAYMFSKPNRLCVLHNEFIDKFAQTIDFLSNLPSFESFNRYAIEIYRKLCERTICHAKGVSDHGIDTMTFCDLYSAMISHCIECGIDLEDFYALDQ